MSYAFTVLGFCLIYGILGLGLNLQMGLTGIANFGYVAFFAIGAYASALLTTVAGWPMPAAWVAAVVIATVLSYPIGLLSIRLGGDYFAIVTLGFAQVVGLFLLNETRLTGGAAGVSGIVRPFATLGHEAANILTVGIMGVAMVITVALTWRVSHSPMGRLLRAIQANEVAAQALGKDTVSYKVLIMAIAAAMAGLAGALFAHWSQYIAPEEFTADVTFNAFFAVILGGLGTLVGPILGAFLLMIFLEGSVALEEYVPFLSTTQLADLRFVLVGVLMLLLIVFRPYGLLGRELGRGRRLPTSHRRALTEEVASGTTGTSAESGR